MKKQAFVNASLAGVSLTHFGLEIPSPFCSLTLNNTETDSYTSWEMNITVGGDASRRVNVAAFEALIYSAAQSKGYANASGIPVTFTFGWIDSNKGQLEDYLSYQGWTMKYTTKTNGQFLTYTLVGYASQILKMNTPVLNIPAVSGWVQPSAVLEGLLKGLKVNDYYDLDIDHCDAPAFIDHNAMTTSLTAYVRGEKNGEDDYDSFPGLLGYSKSYNSTRSAAGLAPGNKLSTLMNHVGATNLAEYLQASLTDQTIQTSTFSFWIDEPTMTQPGTMHYKCTSTIMTSKDSKVLKYGTPDTNVLTLSGSYNGVAYNMSDMSFSTLGFTLDAEGNTIVNPGTITNSWSNSLQDVFKTANIVNDINALSTQFSGDITVTIPGATRGYTICEPVSLVVMNGNTLSPISGIYNIKSTSHTINTNFVTTLKLQRLAVSRASEVASNANIYVVGTVGYTKKSFTQTKNIISFGKVDFGNLYPTYKDLMYT